MKAILVIMAAVGFFLLISVVNAFATLQTVHPRRGEGPVQIAERCGVDPKVFIKLNRDRFVNPRRVSLVYTWQEFVLPETKEVGALQPNRSENISPNVEQQKNEPIKTSSNVAGLVEEIALTPAMKAAQDLPVAVKTKADKFREVVSGVVSVGKKVLIVAVLIFVIYVLIMCWGAPLLEKRFPGIKLLIVITNKPAGGFLEYLKISKRREESDKFICRCREDGVYTCVDWDDNFCKFPDGLTALAKFLAEQDGLRPVYAVPLHLTDRYAPFNTSEQRTLEKYREEILYSS